MEWGHGNDHNTDSDGNHDADHHCGSDSYFAGVCFEVVTPSLVCGLVFKRYIYVESRITRFG